MICRYGGGGVDNRNNSTLSKFKHFHMIFIYEKYNNLNEKKLSVSQISDRLKTIYDLNSLVSGPSL